MYESGACTFVHFKDLLGCFLTCVLHMQVTMLWGMFHLICTRGTTSLDEPIFHSGGYWIPQLQSNEFISDGIYCVCRGGAFCVDDFGISCKKVIYV